LLTLNLFGDTLSPGHSPLLLCSGGAPFLPPRPQPSLALFGGGLTPGPQPLCVWGDLISPPSLIIPGLTSSTCSGTFSRATAPFCRVWGSPYPRAATPDCCAYSFISLPRLTTDIRVHLCCTIRTPAVWSFFDPIIPNVTVFCRHRSNYILYSHTILRLSYCFEITCIYQSPRLMQF
jgi:hypothetical protein